MLSDSAFNALLKTLEEPPGHVVFILATTELNALPKTVLSRCQRFDFRHIDERAMVKRMREVLDAISKTADEEALLEIAGAAEGGLRDALTILDKCCSLAEHITLDTVSEVLNFADQGLVTGFCRHWVTMMKRRRWCRSPKCWIAEPSRMCWFPRSSIRSGKCSISRSRETAAVKRCSSLPGIGEKRILCAPWIFWRRHRIR